MVAKCSKFCRIGCPFIMRVRLDFVFQQVEDISEEEDDDEIMDVDDIFGITSVLNITARKVFLPVLN